MEENQSIKKKKKNTKNKVRNNMLNMKKLS